MSGHKPWSEISAKVRVDPERRARIELREALGATQESVAERMNVTQSNVSYFERNPNIFLRSLASYVEALGGRLEVRAVFPDQVVTLAVSSTQRQPSGPGTS